MLVALGIGYLLVSKYISKVSAGQRALSPHPGLLPGGEGEEGWFVTPGAPERLGWKFFFGNKDGSGVGTFFLETKALLRRGRDLRTGVVCLLVRWRGWYVGC